MSFLRPTALKTLLFLGLFLLPWSGVELLPGSGLPLPPELLGAMGTLYPIWTGTSSLVETGAGYTGLSHLATPSLLDGVTLFAGYLICAAAGSVTMFLVKLYLAVFRWQG